MDFKDINWIVLAVLLCIFFFTWNGYKKGFVKIIISIISMVLTFYLVWVVTPYISDYLINETTLYETTVEHLNEAFREANSQRDNTLYENQVETINSYELPQSMKKMLIDNDTDSMYQSLMVTVFEDYVSSFLAKILIKVLAFIFSYLMVMIFLKMTFLSMEFISKIPVISGLNRFAGLVFGCFEGFFIVWMSFIILSVFFNEWFVSYVRTSHILSYLYENNMILQILIK